MSALRASRFHRYAQFLAPLLAGVVYAGAAAAQEEFETSFEGISQSEFTVFDSPNSVTFSGDAFSDTVGNQALYSAGLYAWMVNAGGTGTIDFETPGASVTFMGRAAQSGGDTVITAFDSQDAEIDSVTLTGGFEQVQFSGGVARIEVVNNGSGMNSVDEFGFTPQETGSGPSGMPVNKGHAGAWLNPATAGQGFFVGVFRRGEQQTPGVFVAWFTFDANGDATKFAGEGQRWFVGQGTIKSDEPSVAEVTLFQTTGGTFNEPFPENQPPADEVGSMTLQFLDCSNGTVSFELFADMSGTDTLSGEVDIQRVTGDPSLCQQLAGDNSQ